MGAPAILRKLTETMPPTIERISAATPEIEQLLTELDRELTVGYDPDQHHALSLPELFQPHIRFYIARTDGTAVGCGGVALFADFAEVKRMYTRPQARGQGVATGIMHRLEAETRAASLPALRLETGVYQNEALAFYERMGFRRIGPFGVYRTKPPHTIELSIFYEKPL